MLDGQRDCQRAKGYLEARDSRPDFANKTTDLAVRRIAYEHCGLFACAHRIHHRRQLILSIGFRENLCTPHGNLSRRSVVPFEDSRSPPQLEVIVEVGKPKSLVVDRLASIGGEEHACRPAAQLERQRQTDRRKVMRLVHQHMVPTVER